MDDNARPHRAPIVREFRQQEAIAETDFEIKLLVITSGKKRDNTDILKLQASFILLFFFNNLRKRYISPQNF
jgi:hypothetical protein